MSQPVRTRFAPSPTGHLHVGNLRIAIFNYLLARRYGGQFVVRIEDTDTERNIPGAVEGILEDLAWAGLNWDEGPDRDGAYGPYLQSQRAGRHAEMVDLLLDRDLAYPCFCSHAELEGLRDGAREDPGCPGGCRYLPNAEGQARVGGGEAAAIRFAVPPGSITIHDAVRGEIRFPGTDVGDFVIRRADGRATYNFAVVADDVDMKISHVIRGAGHLSNTPKQALLFAALGSEQPTFAHLPTVLGADGRKLSKRTGAPGVRNLREEGMHPVGVVNYLSLLGWSPGDDREVLTMDELTAAMDLHRVGASDTMFDPGKLRWMSGRHLAAMDTGSLTAAIEPWLDRVRFPDLPPSPIAAVEAVRTRLEAFGEVNDHLELVFAGEPALQSGWEELRQEPGAAPTLQAIRRRLGAVAGWSEDELSREVREAGKELGTRGPALFHPVRLAVCGNRSGPDLGKVLAALGKERTLALLERAIQHLTTVMDPP